MDEARGYQRFASRTAVVAGGASGIGRALARLLHSEGADVVILDKNRPLPEEGATSLQVDITREDEVVKAIAEITARKGPISLLANCAGIGIKSPLLETSVESWDTVMSVNVTGMFLVCREVCKRMRENRLGSVINVASVDAHAADPGYGSYNASKAAVLGLTRSFAIEMAALGIRVNSVSPGLVMTPMIENGSAASATTRDHLLNDFRRVPMRRVLQPEEVAAACAFLLSDQAGGITGSDLIIDGGMMADSFLMNSLPA